MDKSNQTAIYEVDLDDSLEEHIEMESATGRFRRGAIKDAQNRAAAEALANNRRDMRIETGSFIARYTQGDAPKKFSLFGGAKKCTVTDASISGLGIESVKGLNKGDKVTLIISDGKKGVIPEFEIIATVMYAGAVDNKKARYGLQYDQDPTTAYKEFLNSETLKHKMEKAAEEEDAKQAAQKRNASKTNQKVDIDQEVDLEFDVSVEKKESEQPVINKAVEKTNQQTESERAIRKERIAKILQKRKA